jgi:hypothetical protein
MQRSTFHTGDFEARHLKPAWQDRADFVIAANISERSEKVEWEQIWARRLSDRRFEICCIPFFAYDLSLGDEVETNADFVIERVVRWGGHFTFRVWFGETRSSAVREEIGADLLRLGLGHEWSSENLLSIGASDQEVAEQLASKLQAKEQDGQLMYETGKSSEERNG